MSARWLACAALAGWGAACGPNVPGARMCETVLDCPHGTGCVDGYCLPVDRDGSVPLADAEVDARRPDGAELDAAPPPDADLGLQGDASFAGSGCTVPPFSGPIEPVEEWSWPPTPCIRPCGDLAVTCPPVPDDPWFPEHVQAVATPTVANLTDDDGDGLITTRDVPDIVLMTYDGSNISANGVIRVLSGRPDALGLPVLHFTIPISDPLDPRYVEPVADIRHDSSTSVAIGDLSGDGVPELVALTAQGPAVAWRNDGTLFWQADEPTLSNAGPAGAPTIADLDYDGAPEVVIGRVVIDHLGNTLWIGDGNLGIGQFGAHSIVANVDLLGTQEVIAGNTVYGADGSILCRYTPPAGQADDGVNAVGDFDDDPEAEIVVVHNGWIRLLEHDCTLKWVFHISDADTTIFSDTGGGAGVGLDCLGSGGGEPTVADFDGDGQPEIGVANANCYTVIDTDGSLLWASRTEDDSSQATGSSVFDFNGDGISEAIYNDEHKVRIYAGPDGEMLYSRFNSSRTRHENPIVADVDDDGNAEVVFVENNEATFACGPLNPMGGAGVHVIGDDPAADGWVPTRRIWN